MSRLPRSHKRQHTQHVLSFLWFISGPRRVRVPCGRRPRVCAGNRSHPVHLTSLCSWTWPQSPAVPRAPRGQPCERSSRVFTGMPLGQTSGSGVSETRRCLHFLAVLPPPPPRSDGEVCSPPASPTESVRHRGFLVWISCAPRALWVRRHQDPRVQVKHVGAASMQGAGGIQNRPGVVTLASRTSDPVPSSRPRLSYQQGCKPLSRP